MHLYNLTRRRWLAHRLQLHHDLFSRARGLLGYQDLPAGHGVWLSPGNAVHTWFMRFPIDVIFIASDLSAARVFHALPPWRSASAPRAFSVVELPAGILACTGTEMGDQLAFTSAGWEPRPPASETPPARRHGILQG